MMRASMSEALGPPSNFSLLAVAWSEGNVVTISFAAAIMPLKNKSLKPVE
jgi:hypothetical protein